MWHWLQLRLYLYTTLSTFHTYDICLIHTFCLQYIGRVRLVWPGLAWHMHGVRVSGQVNALSQHMPNAAISIDKCNMQFVSEFTLVFYGIIDK